MITKHELEARIRKALNVGYRVSDINRALKAKGIKPDITRRQLDTIKHKMEAMSTSKEALENILFSDAQTQASVIEQYQHKLSTSKGKAGDWAFCQDAYKLFASLSTEHQRGFYCGLLDAWMRVSESEKQLRHKMALKHDDDYKYFGNGKADTWL